MSLAHNTEAIGTSGIRSKWNMDEILGLPDNLAQVICTVYSEST